METTIPLTIQPLLDAYIRALEPLHEHFYGIYIYGSIALNAFEEQESDIDIIALTQGEMKPGSFVITSISHLSIVIVFKG